MDIYNPNFHIHDLIFYMMGLDLDLTQFCVMDSDPFFNHRTKDLFPDPSMREEVVGWLLRWMCPK